MPMLVFPALCICPQCQCHLSVNISAFHFTTNDIQIGQLLQLLEKDVHYNKHASSYHMLADHYHCLDSHITVPD